jgi:SAM-dependent methyltransferase
VRFGPDDPEADPRLPAIYDAENTWGADDDLFVELVGPPPRRVVDLGCGTGRLTIALADAGHVVTGVEPNPVMLHRARSKPGAERVEWLAGRSDVLPSSAFDVALMTSHVAQVFVDDEEWLGVLRDLRRGLVDGGTLAFDARDPRARGWEAWTADASRVVVDVEGIGPVETWVDVVAVDGDVATYTWANVLPDGDVIEGRDSLRFRSEAQLRANLTASGFDVRQLFGGWQRQPVGPGTGELVVVASAV